MAKKKTQSADLFGGVPDQVVSRPNRLYYGDNLTIMRSMPTAADFGRC